MPKKKSAAQIQREIDTVVPPMRLKGRVKGNFRVPRAAFAAARGFRLQLTPRELAAVEFTRGRYAWSEMLAAHASEAGLVVFSESELWQWADDVDSDAGVGHTLFPLASDELAGKLQHFYDIARS